MRSKPGRGAAKSRRDRGASGGAQGSRSELERRREVTQEAGSLSVGAEAGGGGSELKRDRGVTRGAGALGVSIGAREGISELKE